MRYGARVSHPVPVLRRRPSEAISLPRRCYLLLNGALSPVSLAPHQPHAKVSRFGKVLNGEIDRCYKIAQQTAVPLDLIYTFAHGGPSQQFLWIRFTPYQF